MATNLFNETEFETMRRRTLLAAVGGVLLTGCVSSDGNADDNGTPPSNGEGSDGPTETATPAEVVDPGPCPETWPVVIQNDDQQDHTLSVRITDADSDEVLDRRFDIRSNARSPSTETIETETEVRYEAEYVVEVTFGGETVTEEVEIDCGSLYIIITDEATVEIRPAIEHE